MHDLSPVNPRRPHLRRSVRHAVLAWTLLGVTACSTMFVPYERPVGRALARNVSLKGETVRVWTAKGALPVFTVSSIDDQNMYGRGDSGTMTVPLKDVVRIEVERLTPEAESTRSMVGGAVLGVGFVAVLVLYTYLEIRDAEERIARDQRR